MKVPEKIGRYEILAELGHGAMGAVYKARDPLMDRTVAVKTILAAALAGPLAAEYRERFQREARAAGRLSHSGIVTVFDVGEHDGTAFLVMEYIAGRTLASSLDAGERYTFDRIAELGAQIAEALAYAHSNGVVHRDIKPANILLAVPSKTLGEVEGSSGGPERAIITDFGVAKLTAAQVTVTGQLLGTPSFMPPESFTGAPIDGRSDIFSLGVILYWMATGDKPFTGDTITAVSYKVVHTDIIPPRKLNPAIPIALERIILRCLEKDPAQRWQTGAELGAALRACAADATVVAVPPPIGDADATLDAHARPAEPFTPRASSPALPPVPAPAAPAPAAQPRWPRYMWIVWAAAAVILFQFVFNTVWGFVTGFREAHEASTQSTSEKQPAAPPPQPAAPPPAAAAPTGAPEKKTAVGKLKKPDTQEAEPPSPAKISPPPLPESVAGVMSREEFEKRFGEQLRKSIDVYRRQMDAVNAARKFSDAAREARHAAQGPVPEGRVRLWIDTTAIPEGLNVVVQMDGQPIYRRTVRPESPPARPSVPGQRPDYSFQRPERGQGAIAAELLDPGAHEFRVLLGVGNIRLGASEPLRGEFAAGHERALRVELDRHRTSERTAKSGAQSFTGLEIRVTLEDAARRR
jgi:serine/threonine-protein kinase